jgi:hypothetical protein
MDSSDEIRAVLLDILKVGLLRIRALCSEGSAEQCGIEADHLHNLPGILQTGNRETLRYYYEAERPSFKRLSTISTDEFELFWRRLGTLLGTVKSA